ncbi:hypothetical protein [Nocardia nepalensis]|uniref:hypothetical protein n=1 Tax=Nocardia nepalensis TaxID=3375448 RepID=UPI003B67344A
MSDTEQMAVGNLSNSGEFKPLCERRHFCMSAGIRHVSDRSVIDMSAASGLFYRRISCLRLGGAIGAHPANFRLESRVVEPDSSHAAKAPVFVGGTWHPNGDGVTESFSAALDPARYRVRMVPCRNPAEALGAWLIEQACAR